MSDASPEVMPSSELPGLDELIERLREAGLPVGTSEAIDAADVLRHLSRSTAVPQQSRAALKGRLRPVLCKVAADITTFDAVFDEWSALKPVAVRAGQSSASATPLPSPSVNVGPAEGFWKRRKARLLLALAFVLAAAATAYVFRERPAEPVPPAPPSASNSKAPTSVPLPLKPAISGPNAIRVYGYFPALRYNTELRPVWLAVPIGVVVLAVLPILLAFPGPVISRMRGRGSVLLQAWPRSRYQERLVHALSHPVEDQLQRYVAGSVEHRHAYARRPLFDPRRTVEATIRRMGIPSPRYRFARLRPAYLVLVEAERDDSFAVLWAERLRVSDTHVDIFRFTIEKADVAPRCIELGGAGRRFSFDALPTPASGQRLVVITRVGHLFDSDSRLWPWVRAARLERWAQRALFSPDEPRDWKDEHINVLETAQGGDPGLLVFPLDDNALAAWSTWLVEGGHVPHIVLSEPQLYPQLLRYPPVPYTDDGWVLRETASLPGERPDITAKRVSALVTQLHAYLGDNGFFWLCACAIPPVFDSRLVMLLGEEYFRRCGIDIDNPRLRHHMARNWRLLERLPWLRQEGRQLPQWLRLALLMRLPHSIQEELRGVVTGALSRKALSDEAGGVQVGFDASGEAAVTDPRYVLFAGFVRGGLSAVQLVLRMPGEWNRWVLMGSSRPSWRHRIAAAWDRLTLCQGVTWLGPSRLSRRMAVGGFAAAACTVAVFVTVTPAKVTPQVRSTLYADQAHAIGARHKGSVYQAAFSPDGTRVVTASDDHTARIWDTASGAALGSALKHGGPVYQAAFSPDGTRIVTASGDRTARVWDAVSGAALGPALRHTGAVRQATFSPDGTRIVTASDDHTARVWDAASGTALVPPLRHEGPVQQATFSPDSKRIVTASADRTARVWDAASGAVLRSEFRHEGPVIKAAFNPDGTRIVTASEDRTARVWDATSGAALGPVLRHARAVRQATFSPDGTRIVTASDDHTARIWDAASGAALEQALRHEDIVWQAVFSPDGTRIVTASSDRTARVWDAASGAALGPALKHEGPVNQAAFSSDGARIVTASSDYTARVWDAAAGAALGPALRHEDTVLQATFSPDGTRIVTASNDRIAQVWDAVSGAAVGSALKHEGSVNQAAFSPDGTRVVTSSDDGTARVWDATSGAALGPALRHEGPVNQVAFSPDGKRIVTASDDRTAQVWDAASGAALAFTLRHASAVRQAAFSSDGTRIVTASSDGTAQVWDAASGAALAPAFRHGSPVNQAVFSPDGKRIVTASSDRTARIWDTASGTALGHVLRHEGPVNQAAFSPDGTRIVTASDDRTARVWDTASGATLGPVLRHEDWVRRAVFSPDGTRIVTASDDRTARVWNATDGTLLAIPLQSLGPVMDAAWSAAGDRLVFATSGAQPTVPADSKPFLNEPKHGERRGGNAAYVVLAPPLAPVPSAWQLVPTAVHSSLDARPWLFPMGILAGAFGTFLGTVICAGRVRRAAWHSTDVVTP